MSDSAPLRIVRDPFALPERKHRTPGERIKQLSTKLRDAELRAAFFEAELQATERRAERGTVALDAILQKLPDDMNERLVALGVRLVGEMTDADFGALLARIEMTRNAQ